MSGLPFGPATGLAAKTVEEHSAENDFKMFGMWFCPFVQRTWIALELKKIPYQYIEINAYDKPKELLEVNPRGLVPAIRQGDWAIYESLVTLDYLEDISPDSYPLLPKDPKKRAEARLWADHSSTKVFPHFQRLIQAQDPEDRKEHAANFLSQLKLLVQAADKDGPFFQGSQIGWVDVVFAPWMVRLTRVLGHYRDWPPADKVNFGDAALTARWAKWVDAVENNDAVKRTMSEEEGYIRAYARYA
ncbi:hypothetical protein KEM54_003164, partial [Ascosphaera aggregata]